MDILGQYQKDAAKRPQPAVRPAPHTEESSSDEGAVTNLIIKLSQGKIQTTDQVNRVMIIIAVIAIIGTIIFLYRAY